MKQKERAEWRKLGATWFREHEDRTAYVTKLGSTATIHVVDYSAPEPIDVLFIDYKLDKRGVNVALDVANEQLM